MPCRPLPQSAGHLHVRFHVQARYCFGVEGSSHFIRAAADVQGEVLEPFFESDDWEYAPEYFTDLPALYANRRPQALASLQVAGAVFAFIGTCFAKKIFDEIYERTAKRPIGVFLDGIFQKAAVPEGKAVEYRDIIYFEDLDLTVVVRALATKETTQEVQTQVLHGHRVAHAFIETHGRKAAIHCHSVVDGQVASQPEYFDTLEEIRQKDRAQLKVTWRK